MTTKKPKARMGRPAGPDAKKHFFGLRLTGEEMEIVRAGAKKAGISMAEFIMAPHRKGKGK